MPYPAEYSLVKDDPKDSPLDDAELSDMHEIDAFPVPS